MVQPDDVQAVVEVFAEPALLDQLLEIRVGGGDDADVDVNGLASPSGLISPDSRKRSSLGCRSRLELADLVEEQRAVLGGADEAGVVAVGAGERAAAVAEQLAFEHLARDGGAVERHERLVRRGRSSGGWRGRGSPCRCRSRR